MTRISLALVASLFAWTVQAATLPVTPDTFVATFAKAQPGDVIACAPGSYGDGDFYGKPATPITITAPK